MAKMPTPRPSRLPGSLLAVLLALALITAACSDDDDAAGQTTSVPAETTLPAPREMSSEDQAAVEAAITAGVERLTGPAPAIAPPGLWVGVWDPEKGSYLTARGDAAEGQPATTGDHFRIGSTTKTFTAAVVLQLVDEAKLTVDDTIGDLLPDVAAAHPEIADVTVESLLNMTSGIEDYLNVPGGVVAEIVADPTRVWEPAELIAAAVEAGVEPIGTAGDSTSNYIALQLIAESIEGKPLPELIEERLTGPLGMADSSLPIEDPTMPDPFAAGHLNPFCVEELTGDGAVGVDTTTDPTGWTISYAQGGGGMTSTLADLGRWADSMSGNQSLSSELQAARLATDTVMPVGPGSPQVPYQYGLGIYQLGDGWFGHDGEAIGWQAIALHHPDTGVSVAMAANTCAAQSLVFMSILNELYPDQVVDDFITATIGG
jgi:D-alanyl-D-alanine carboxypeptidase